VSTLIITRGLPGSGKTTYAKKWVGENTSLRARVNRDDLREILHGGAHGYPRELESSVTFAHQASVRALLMSGKDVIVDDMNLQNKQVKAWMKVANEAKAGFEVVDFTNVTVGTCIDRDKSRFLQGGRHVGEEYITKKYQQFIKGRPYPLPMPEEPAKAYREPYVPPKSARKCILVDIDGTMALMNGRGPFEWWRVGEDLPNQAIVDLVWAYYRSPWVKDVELIFMSGRDEVCRPETTKWLTELGFPVNQFTGIKLFMRPSLPDGVQQPADHVVKLALFDEHIRYNYNVQFVLDDRNQVVDMWRELGLTCLQVAPGDF
jgi:predicted kinase